jgi:hypothetical protein
VATIPWSNAKVNISLFCSWASLESLPTHLQELILLTQYVSRMLRVLVGQKSVVTWNMCFPSNFLWKKNALISLSVSTQCQSGWCRPRSPIVCYMLATWTICGKEGDYSTPPMTHSYWEILCRGSSWKISTILLCFGTGSNILPNSLYSRKAKKEPKQ